ncbi:hypothetical protein C2G38_2251351 [Gigaspora rosea]|uniref:SAP domain-containing protein n=1 Tax=Gigaspora rosea TaxID=44941 RepID=A0A397UJS7_9GLOM|nr:hypothetical protein C2G38_2251351 [Gigaspora rosea]
MAQLDNGSELQEILPTSLPKGSNLEGDSEKYGSLSLEMLKMLCKDKELSEVGTKKELVDRLASRIVDKAREKDRGKKNNRSKNRQEGRVDTDLGFAIREENFDRRSETTDGDAGVQGFSVPDLQYIAIEKSLEKMVQATMEKVVNDFRKCMQSVDEYKYWAKEKMNKPRDQFEYDEWCRIGRVAKRKGWNMAAEIKDSSDEDPMNPKVENSAGLLGTVVAGLPVGFGNLATN